MDGSSITSWLYFYIAASIGMAVFFRYKYKHLRPVLDPILPEDLDAYLREKKPHIVDVRSDKEWERDAWPQAENIQHDQIELISADKEDPIFLVCNSGIRSSDAAETLVRKGYRRVSYYKGYHKDVIQYFEKQSSAD